jgi:hypothetical protein
MTQEAPLTTQLSWAWIALAIEIDNSFEAASSRAVGRTFRISVAMWTNGLRPLDQDGVTVDELRTRARASCNLGGLERWGWITIGDPNIRRPGYGTHRGVKGDSVLRPTRAGAYALRMWPRVLSEVEERWRERFGSEVVDAFAATLRGIPSAEQMPWSPPEVHPSDGFVTAITNGIPENGDRPLVALLGQALTFLTLEHEHGTRSSLPLAANVIRLVGDEAVRIPDLPRLSGVSKEGIAMAVGYLERRRLARSADRVVRLTVAGRASLADYRHRADELRNDELLSAVRAILGQRDALSKGLVPPDGCWRGEKPYLSQTRRLIADPTGSLPWHPMVLHRGGWPDAS